MTIDPQFLEGIKKSEGFTPRATWDYKQNSVGYGTRAKFPGEVIDQAEAERRLNDEIASAAAIVDKFAPNLDPGTRAALTSLTFNAGSSWTQAGLGQAIKAGDLNTAKQIFLQYNKAGGEELPGLAARRQREVAWFGAGSPAGAPQQPAGGQTQAAAPNIAQVAAAVPESNTGGFSGISNAVAKVKSDGLVGMLPDPLASAIKNNVASENKPADPLGGDGFLEMPKLQIQAARLPKLNIAQARKAFRRA